LTPTIHTHVQFWLLMHPKERQKPSNTGRLLGATMPQTRFFLWQRTAPPGELIDLIGDCRFAPYLVFPHGDPGPFEHLRAEALPTGKIPAFVLLDGTWDQATKMLHRSPYLWGLRRLSITPRTRSTYLLRRQSCADHLATVEVAIALLAQVESTVASQMLEAYFRVFVASFMATRHGHLVHQALPEMLQLLAYKRQHQTAVPLPS
jgi:DTW domain-containing protein YfiP